MRDVGDLPFVAIFAAQPKRSGALLGSNPVRNRLCDMTASLEPHPCSGCGFAIKTCLIVRQCQEKPVDEPLASRLAHAAVVVQVFLQVCEHALDLVVRVGHPLASLLLEGEEVWQVKGDAVHGRPQSLVRVVRPSGALAQGLAVERKCPVLLPLGELLHELVLLQRGQPAHESLEGDGGLEPWLLGEVAVDYRAHVELAHLDLVHAPEHVEQAAHAVYDDALDGVAHARYRLHCQHVVRDGLVPDEGDVERSAGGIVKREQNAPVASPVGHVEVDVSAHPVKAGLLPSYGDCAQPSLDRRLAFADDGGNLPNCLLVVHVQRPELAVGHLLACSELPTAGHALVKLLPVPRAVALRYPRTARRAFFCS